MDTNLLSVKGLQKSYKDLTALSNLNLNIRRGEIFGLLGPNGAGKTTSLECILGTRKADRGEVYLLGQKVGTHRRELFEKVGVQFQDSRYPDLIRVDELCRMKSVLYKEVDDHRVLLEQFSIASKLNTRVSELSGGERQKLSVVLALINRPEIVFLDELTSGLDPKSRRDVWGYIKSLKDSGVTIVLTSHYMDEVNYLCDRVLILNRGETVIQGSPAELIRTSGKESLEEAYLLYIGEEKEDEALVRTV